jgi:putative ABC transport system permease protein
VYQAARGLIRAKGFAFVAALTLALGIGASTALFTIVRGVLLRPLPYRDADRLAVIVAEQDFEGSRQPVRTQWPFQAAAAWPRSGAIDGIGFYSPTVAALATAQAAELIDAAYVSASFFDTLGGQMLLGRGLAPSDDLQPVAIISERLWQRLYARDASVLGKSATLSGQVYTIVGVAAESFQIPRPKTDAWLPAGVVRTRNPSCCSFSAIARLNAGVTLAAATQEITAVAQTLAAQMPRALGGVRVHFVSLQDSIVGGTRPALRALTAAVGLLLVLSCANVMNLLMARNTARRHEAAVRRALGASRGRLAAHVLAESALLSSAGAALGIAVAAGALRMLEFWPPAGMPRLDAIRIDGFVLLFACVIAAATTIAIGLWPALRSDDVANPLRDARGSVGSRTSRLALRAVTVAQLAISLVLLVSAALVGRSLVALMRTDLGVTADHVATASLNLSMGRTLSDQQQLALIDRVVARVSSLPNVAAVGVGTARPPDASRLTLTLNRSNDPNARASYAAAGVAATPGYFRALGIRLERGRFFTDADTMQAPPVVMMSADTARQLFGTDDPIGRTIELPVLRNGAGGRETMTVVGITSSVKYSGMDRLADALVYRPFAQQPFRSLFLVVRTTGDPGVVASQLQREIAAVDRGIVTAEITTLESLLADATAQPRFRTILLATFASMAIVIAAVGLYGIIAYSVSQRRAEISVRMALGATSQRIRMMVLREGMVLAIAGGALGLAGAYSVSRLLSNLLYGIPPNDPWSFATASAGVVVAGLVASYVPAARAAASDPLAALRAE